MKASSGQPAAHGKEKARASAPPRAADASASAPEPISTSSALAADPAASAPARPGSSQPASLIVHVRGVGLLGPGLPDWTTGRELLLDPARWTRSPTIVTAPTRLPSAERRRAGEMVKLSLAVAEQASGDAGIDPRLLATVFSASTGDANNCHALCEALAQPEPLLSPTRFTNSVHNAAAGYWHIACASRAPSTSLCGYDGSFGAGLLEAVTQCAAGQVPVLLVAADVPYPEPLHTVRPISDTLGAALVLTPAAATGDIARLELRLSHGTPTSCGDPRLDALRDAEPTGRGLPLLQALASAKPCTVTLAYLDGLSLEIAIFPSASV